MRPITDVNILDTTDKMVYGHEPWLEMRATHCHPGGTAELMIKWGHNMQSEGLLRREGMEAFCLTPGGGEETARIEEGGADYYRINYQVAGEGIYHLVVKNRGNFVLDREYAYHEGTLHDYPDAAHGILYLQFAQFFLEVGHDLTSLPRRAGLQLEIVPTAWRQWRVGDTIPLQVYFRENLLATTVLDMACQSPDGYRQWKEEADENGLVNFRPELPGRYLAVARRQVQEKLEGAYDSVALTATLPFIVRKR